jgi:hypothetical protein
MPGQGEELDFHPCADGSQTHEKLPPAIAPAITNAPRSAREAKMGAHAGEENCAPDDCILSLRPSLKGEREMGSNPAGTARAGISSELRRVLLPHCEELRMPPCPFSNLPDRTKC